MNIYPHIPYTYLIGWTQHNKYYYGVQYGKKSNPANLWKTYFTSSNYVKQFRIEHGEPDVIQVRKCFCSASHARKHEHLVLKRLRSKNKSMWLNVSNGGEDFGSAFLGRQHSASSKQKISKAKMGKPLSVEHKNKIKLSKQNLSKDTHNKMSDAAKAKIITDSHRKKLTESTAKTYKVMYLNKTEKIVTGLRQFCRDELKISVQLFEYHRGRGNLSKYNILHMHEVKTQQESNIHH